MNARELVDAYAKRSIFQGTEDDPYPEPSVQQHEPYAPLAFAALRAVLERHKPEPVGAYVYAKRFGKGKCFYCAQSDPVGVDIVRGTAFHVHKSPVPHCPTCRGETGEPVASPCPTEQDIITALEAK